MHTQYLAPVCQILMFLCTGAVYSPAACSLSMSMKAENMLRLNAVLSGIHI